MRTEQEIKQANEAIKWLTLWRDGAELLGNYQGSMCNVWALTVLFNLLIHEREIQVRIPPRQPEKAKEEKTLRPWRIPEEVPAGAMIKGECIDGIATIAQVTEEMDIYLTDDDRTSFHASFAPAHGLLWRYRHNESWQECGVRE